MAICGSQGAKKWRDWLCHRIILPGIAVIIDSGGKDKILTFTLPLGDTDNGHSWDRGSTGAGSVVLNVMFRPPRNSEHLGKSIKCQVSVQIHVLSRQRTWRAPIVTTVNHGKKTECHLPHHKLIAWLYWCYSTRRKRSWVWHWIYKDGSHVWPKDVSAHKQADPDVSACLTEASTHPPEEIGLWLIVLYRNPDQLFPLLWGDRHGAPDNEGRLLEIWTGVPSLGMAFFHCRGVPTPWAMSQRENFAPLNSFH